MEEHKPVTVAATSIDRANWLEPGIVCVPP